MSLSNFQNCSFLYCPSQLVFAKGESELYRSRVEIIAEIVLECLAPRRKTNIMQRRNISSSLTDQCLSLLVSSKLLLEENGKYRTTDRGLEFLSVYDQLNTLLQMPTMPIGESAHDSRRLIQCGSKTLVQIGR